MSEAIDYALMIGEIEGVYSKLKVLGTADEVTYIEQLKKKYYKEYFALLKKQREAEA